VGENLPQVLVFGARFLADSCAPLRFLLPRHAKNIAGLGRFGYWLHVVIKSANIFSLFRRLQSLPPM
jgi:hypothetical protein